MYLKNSETVCYCYSNQLHEPVAVKTDLSNLDCLTSGASGLKSKFGSGIVWGALVGMLLWTDKSVDMSVDTRSTFSRYSTD